MKACFFDIWMNIHKNMFAIRLIDYCEKRQTICKWNKSSYIVFLKKILVCLQYAIESACRRWGNFQWCKWCKQKGIKKKYWYDHGWVIGKRLIVLETEFGPPYVQILSSIYCVWETLLKTTIGWLFVVVLSLFILSLV